MKTKTQILTFILFFITAIFGLQAQNTYHPDDKEALRAFLRQPAPLDYAEKQSGQYTGCNAYNAGITDTSNWETDETWITQITASIVLTWNNYPIPKRLGKINMTNNYLAGDLNLSKCEALDFLRCYLTAVKTINVSGCEFLRTLRCSACKLVSLNISGCKRLDELWCDANQLTTLDVSENTLLTDLSCRNNYLTELDVSKNTELRTLDCGSNQIKILDVSDCKQLQVLYCFYNQLTTLDVFGNRSLNEILCHNNQLKTFYPPNYHYWSWGAALDCRSNQLRLSMLPESYFYAPQDTIKGDTTSYVAGINLNDEYDMGGHITSFVWYDISTGTEQPITLQGQNGIFSLDNSYMGKKLRCKMLNAYFPNFTINKPLVYEVTITNHTPVGNIKIYPDTLYLKNNETKRIMTTIIPANASDKKISWESRDTNIVKVSKYGHITPVSMDQTYVVVTTHDGLYKDSCLVIVPEALYGESDKEALRAFLRQPSSVAAQCNAQQLGLALSDTLNWETSEAWIIKLEGLTWGNGGPKNVYFVDWNNKKLSGNLDLTGFNSLQIFECTNNQIVTLKTFNSFLAKLLCNNNAITSLNITQNRYLEELNCGNNLLKFSTLPRKGIQTYVYFPQDTIKAGNIDYNLGIDLSAEYDINDSITTFSWYDISDGTEQAIALQGNNGIFSLDNSYLGKTLRCKMLNGYFPQFTPAQPLVYEVNITDGTDVPVTGISLNQQTLSLKVDSTKTLVETILPNNATNQNVTWESRDENIATVDNNGIITGIAVGNTYIVVTTEDGNFQDSCLVTVEPNLGIEDLQHQQEKLKIYPNPTSGKLIFENENLTTKAAELFDLNGRLISTFKIVGKKTEIDISHLPNGTYLIKTGRIITKVVKQ